MAAKFRNSVFCCQLVGILLVASACDRLPWSRVAKSHKIVAGLLNDPESAQFRNEAVEGAAVCGEVNAKNQMGGYVGFSRYIATPSVGKAMVTNGSPDFAEYYRDLENEFLRDKAGEKIVQSCTFEIAWRSICKSHLEDPTITTAYRQCQLYASQHPGDEEKLKKEVGLN